MTLHEDARQQNVHYHFSPPRERFWLTVLLWAVVIFFYVAGFVVMSDVSPLAWHRA